MAMVVSCCLLSLARCALRGCRFDSCRQEVFCQTASRRGVLSLQGPPKPRQTLGRVPGKQSLEPVDGRLDTARLEKGADPENQRAPSRRTALKTGARSFKYTFSLLEIVVLAFGYALDGLFAYTWAGLAAAMFWTSNLRP